MFTFKHDFNKFIFTGTVYKLQECFLLCDHYSGGNAQSSHRLLQEAYTCVMYVTSHIQQNYSTVQWW